MRLHTGLTKNVLRQITASTAIAAGALVAWSSGKLIEATSTTDKSVIEGVLVKAITATDTDYATERKVLVKVPVEKNTEWEIAVTSGLVAADRGLYQDLTDGSTVDRSGSTYDVVKCVEVLSPTLGIFNLNISGAGN